MDNISKMRHYAVTIILIGVFFFMGMEWGNRSLPEIKRVEGVTATNVPEGLDTDFSIFWKAWNKINEKHPNAGDISDKDKIQGAIAGLVDSLGDPYSVYYDAEETKAFKEDISGNFEGIGMEVGIKEEKLIIIAPLKNTPAYRAGLKSGDEILKIGDKVTSGLSVEEAVKLIRGKKGTTVRLTIFRKGEKEPRELTIMRERIQVPTMETEVRPDGIFIIRIYTFTGNVTSQFRQALKEFANTKSDKLLIDLRGNPGGYLSASIDMASWFLPSGKIVVTEDYGKKKEPEVYRSRGYDIFTDKLKLVILIDGGSASASEIFAGALQSHGRAKLVGVQSFGKGSVQEVINITRDTVLKLTVAKWLTPDGTSLSEKGLTPDFVVEMKKEDVEAKKDPQLDKAVEVLNNWK